MRVALYTQGEVGVRGRGIGVYTKLLFDELFLLSKEEKSTVDIELVNNFKNKDFDLIHYPSFDLFFKTLNPPKNIPFVVTVHDTIPLIYPSHYPPGLRGRLAFGQQKRSLSHAKAIITDSKTSQKDIVRFLNVAASKIYPIYLGPTVTSPTDFEKMAKMIFRKYDVDFEYVIYVGDVNWNKNVVCLAEACEQARLHLVIVGKMAVSNDYDKNHIENKSLRALQDRFATSGFVHRIGFVQERELSYLIGGSVLLCQPSFYEGFGLGVLDAMSLGVPTVCAKVQTLVELYEDASIFFDPHDVSSMAGTLSKVFVDTKLKRKLAEEGRALSKHFGWKKTAKETLEVYKVALNFK